MIINDENKKQLQEDINNDINDILEKYNLPYRIDGISIMKTSKGSSFLGNVRVHDPEKVKLVHSEIESYLSKFGKVTINSRDVVPCCEAPYTYLTFHINFK